MLMRHKQETGNVFEVNNKKIEFRNSSISSLTQSDLIDNVILKVAAKNNITDLKQIDTNNKFMQLQVVQELANLGMIANLSDIKLDENEKEMARLMKGINDRIGVIATNNPEAAKEKLTQLTITEYMQKNGIDNPEQLKSEEHSETLKNDILSKFGIETQKSEDEIFDEKIVEIVKKAMETSATTEEIQEKVEEESKKVFEQIYEDENNKTQTHSIAEELGERRREYLPNERKNLDETTDEFSVIQNEIVERQTKQVIDNIDDIIKLIENRQEDKNKNLDFIDEIISSVQVIENETPSVTEDEKHKISSSDSIIKEILSQDAKRKREGQIQKLNSELEIFEEALAPKKVDYGDGLVLEEFSDVSIEFAEENLSGDNDKLIATLLAAREQDKVALELRFKPEGSEKKRLMQMDEERIKNTYETTRVDVSTSVDDIIKMIKNKN